MTARTEIRFVYFNAAGCAWCLAWAAYGVWAGSPPWMAVAQGACFVVFFYCAHRALRRRRGYRRAARDRHHPGTGTGTGHTVRTRYAGIAVRSYTGTGMTGPLPVRSEDTPLLAYKAAYLRWWPGGIFGFEGIGHGGWYRPGMPAVCTAVFERVSD